MWSGGWRCWRGSVNKLGLYVQVGHDPEIRGKLEKLRPSVVLCHLDGGDLPDWIRANLPDTFVIGRYFWTPEQQESLLYSPGASLAGHVLAQKGSGACDAFMLFNEFLGSPVDNGGLPEFRAKAQRFDALQCEYRQILKAKGYESVAWNLAAGNWPTAEHYREHFPLTLAEYRYLGFHVYGWPKLAASDWRSNLAETLRIADGFPAHTCVITEMAVTRAYGNQGPDVGWLSQPDPLTLDAYAADLEATHAELCKRANVKGAALFNAAPEATWRTFAAPQELIDKVSGFKCQEGGHGDPPVQPAPGLPVRLQMPVNHTRPASVVSQWWGENPPNYNGWGHEGVDFALPTGTPVFAACAGKVHKTMLSPVYGKYVRVQSTGVLQTADGTKTATGAWETVYAHLSEIAVKPGQVVQAGELLGAVGSTGRSTGAHLHFGLRLPGQKSTDKFWGYSDPAPWLGLAKATQPAPQTAVQLLDQAMALLVKAKELM